MIHNEQDGAADAYFSSSVLRRFAGPEANEIFLLCRPESLRPGEIAYQTESVYRTLRDLLQSEGGGLEHVVQEAVYFRNIREDLSRFQQARLQVVKETGLEAFDPASTFIEQPPLNDSARLEISVLAVIPHDQRAAKVWNVWRTSQCVCNDCARIGAQVQLLGGQKYLRAGNIYGASGTTYAETYDMFVSAEELLRQEGMGFGDVVRTWIYLREMDRDYAEFNRGRREFFHDRGIKLHPASTGIYGAPFPEGHNFLMGIYAIKSPDSLQVKLMTTPTLNEAWMYGSDFSRGLKVVEANKIALYVSGTASVDEAGETAHVGDFDGQVERMIVNISTLLAAQNASLGDLVSATTYLKSSEDAPRLRRILRQRGLAGCPNALVKAAVCRPNLLCEMEAIAALPRPV
jgi:enamine deaminase RidA (YjgF/YER057c/UK114 family)